MQGSLIGVPFRNGIAELGGGMPAAFEPRDHALARLCVAEHNGAIFVTFIAETEPFEDYLGPAMLEYFDGIFDGRELTL